MKVVIIILCVLLGLLGLFMSACGGFFTIVSLPEGRDGLGIVAIALPFLVAGIACVWGAVAGFRRVNRKSASAPDNG